MKRYYKWRFSMSQSCAVRQQSAQNRSYFDSQNSGVLLLGGIFARIARDHPDVLRRMQEGEYTSMRAAAIDAGILKPRVSIPLVVEDAARLLKRHFADDLDKLIALLQAENE